ncbi:hypothetical protein AHAS_Ahas03G0360300 [Arachis hypogaea]
MGRIDWVGGTQDGDFSVTSTYKALANLSPSSTTNWIRIWKWQRRQKSKVFMWRVLHNRLFTNQRKSRIFGGGGTCQLCGEYQEDTIHVLRDCPSASMI